ncbi:uncharacterized protein LOC105162239 isoform X1 [Sesamum indicum]|uniref:Uncharacterized protein LOC105162239 isoform X1 n=1 Tax=Sesamum indicum TaxID=4182 RepID=A0A6I9T5Y3_SESIN|nr:uncharacterized protein LOC105162239 isoform X1 [Sesamum indicum]
MGKRKRSVDDNKAPPPSEFISHAPQVDLQCQQRSSDRAESSATQSLPSIMDGSVKRPPGHQSPLNQSHGSSRTILLRHSRHPFGRHYSRRSSTNHSDASPSNWKSTPVYDTKLSFKLDSKDLPDFPYREVRDRTFSKPERIRSTSSFAQNAVPGDMRKMECRICQKRLRKNPFIFNNSISSNDLSVVAVLVCGHAYHADCLEQKTSFEDRQDPPCPMCKPDIPGDA